MIFAFLICLLHKFTLNNFKGLLDQPAPAVSKSILCVTHQNNGMFVESHKGKMEMMQKDKYDKMTIRMRGGLGRFVDKMHDLLSNSALGTIIWVLETKTF